MYAAAFKVKQSHLLLVVVPRTMLVPMRNVRMDTCSFHPCSPVRHPSTAHFRPVTLSFTSTTKWYSADVELHLT